MNDSVIAAAKPRFRIAWEAVGFESGFGPKGPWEVRLRVSTKSGVKVPIGQKLVWP